MTSGLTLPLPVVPDPSSPRARQVLLDAVADDVPIRMLLDTGTYRSSVPHRDALAGRLRPEGPDPNTGAGQHDERLVRLETLQWGSLTARGLTVSLQAPGWPHPPLLGMDVLGPHACHFRFTEGVLELDGPAPTDALLPLPTPSNKSPAVPVHWGNTTVDAVWDTGAGITIVDRTWAESHPEIVTITHEFGTGTDVYGNTGRNPKGRLAPCRIGNVTFPEQDCGVPDLSSLNITMFLGLPLISHADWYMDFPRRHWRNSAP
ncbi:aspartyl protease family protein [Actinopolymorpha sp. B11F2]|uniref:aspartyl protease family protein n=1 Tax=Actinopolymorpha sp. B11F2 TaxID=3160862 RepID=UPI0032E42B4A